VSITGYWFLDPHPNWQPDPALTEFIKSAPKPIYIGFGSMGNPAKNEITGKIILESSRKNWSTGNPIHGVERIGNRPTTAKECFPN
jgi:hypothetical protein